MTEEQRRAQAKKIIEDTATTAATSAALLSQIPGTGITTLTALYLQMENKIAKLFGQKLESPAARKLLLTACEHHARMLVDKSVLGWIPLIGNGINAKITFDVTKKIGWFFYNHFAQNSE